MNLHNLSRQPLTDEQAHLIRVIETNFPREYAFQIDGETVRYRLLNHIGPTSWHVAQSSEYHWARNEAVLRSEDQLLQSLPDERIEYT